MKGSEDRKIKSLLDDLSIQEKIAQLDLALATSLPRFVGVSPERYFNVLRAKGTPREILEILENLERYEVCDDAGNFNSEQARKMLVENSFGSVWGLCQAGAPSKNYENAKKIQKLARKQLSKDISLLIFEEGLHGFLAPGSTIFPQAICLAASFDPILVERIGYAIGREAYMRGANGIFAPVLDLALDARWGRCEETFGSDPFLVSEMGSAFVRGLRKAGIAPIAKHFCGHGSVRGGRDSNDNALSVRELRSLHLRPFKAVVEAGALGIVSAYHAIDGCPCTANELLLKKTLREEWGFKGLTVSDAGAIEDLYRRYAIVEDFKGACELAIKAGLEIHNNGPNYKATVLKLIDEGKIRQEDIDVAVEHVLFVKDQLNLLNVECPDEPFDNSVWVELRNGNADLAKHAAQCGLTLLKNDGNILPIRPGEYPQILVCGSLAKDGRALLGDYCLDNTLVPDIYSELCKHISGQQQISYLEGYSFDNQPTVQLERSFSLVEKADLVLLFIGETSGFGENTLSGEGYDRVSVEVAAPQRALIRKLEEFGTPVIGIVLAGRALALERVIDVFDAILYCYFPGEAGAAVIAETIFGINSPQGNLPYDLPRQSGQLPIFYHQLPSGRAQDYCDLPGSPLFPFGYGLRYTNFEIGELHINVLKKAPDPIVEMRVEVRNCGEVASSVLVQIYCQDIVSSVLTPRKRLCAFDKRWLRAGEGDQLVFQLGFDAFALLDSDHVWRVEPGEFELSVAFSSDDIILCQVISL
jgi:beta-glucosidase